MTHNSYISRLKFSRFTVILGLFILGSVTATICAEAVTPNLFETTLGSSTPTRPPSNITCIPKKTSIYFGEPLIVSGAITPPVAGAPIFIEYKMGSALVTRTEFTDSDGTYTFSATIRRDEGSWTVEAYWNGNDQYLGARSKPATFTLNNFPLTSVKIVVIDNEGRPLAGAIISSKTKPGEQAILNAVSGADGSCMFTSVMAGTYSFQASKEGFITNSGTLVAFDWTTNIKSITLQPEVIEEEVSAPPNGVPGYPLEVMMIGVIVGIGFMLFRRNK